MSISKSIDPWTEEQINGVFEAVRRLHDIEIEDDQDDSAELSKITALAEHLTGQLIFGCGDPSCNNIHCHTGRRNTSITPVRGYTARSARSIAVGLLFGSSAEQAKCQHFKPANLDIPDQQERDHTSLTQVLGDTKAFRSLTSKYGFRELSSSTTSRNTSRRKFRHLQAMLRDIRVPPFNVDGTDCIDFVPDRPAVVQLLTIIFYVIYHLAPLDVPADILAGLLQFSRPHKGEPISTDKVKDDEKAWIEKLSHICQHSQSYLIVRELCETIAYRWALESVMTKVRPGGESFFSMLDWGQSRAMLHDCEAFDKDVLYTIFTQLIKQVILDKWDGSFIFKRYTTIHVAFEMLESFSSRSWHQPRVWMSDLTSYLDIAEGAETWLSFDREKCLHILYYSSFHNLHSLRDYFHMINHIKMRQVHATKSILDGLRHEFLCNLPSPLSVRAERRLEDLQQSFLVLRVRRSNVLEDAFDQLYRVYASELYRPLRVRIVEMDGQAIGQDLGGVQIEFFNLVVEALLAEDAGLFVVKEQGYHYPRPGSLQPLFLYEYIGVLFGLALYNGIPLPVSFPTAFYKLLSSTWNDSIFNTDDAWKSEHTSFLKMYDEDVTDWGLTYDFNLQANGLHIVLSKAACVAFSTDETVIPVSSVTFLDEPARVIEPEDIAWPGWQFVHASDPSETPVTEQSKEAYIEDYDRMNTYWLVRPQIDAIVRGFTRIIDTFSLQLVPFGPLFEGTTEVDLERIRENTRYEGFESNEGYIDAFWKTIGAWADEQHRALIKFVTAAERIPWQSKLSWKITRAQDDDDQRLPTSSTCFSTLYLPKYSTVEILNEKLIKAVELGEYGFFVG